MNYVILWIVLIATGPIQIRAGIDYCKLKGSVYIEEYPAQADILVFEETSEAFADMLIYEVDNALFADKPGLWFFVEKKAFADFTIGFVESKNQADFSIYFTPFESFAGCQNE